MSENTSLEKTSAGPLETPATITVPAYPVAQEEEGPALSLFEYWKVIRKRRWTVLSILLLVVTTVMIGTLKQRPVYRAKVVVQIDRENQNILTFQDFVSQIDPYDETFMETAYKVIQSRSLARRVITKLSLGKLPEFQPEPSSWPSLWPSKPQSPQPTSALEDTDPETKALIDDFLSRLTVVPVRRSRLVEISFDAYDPVLGTRVVNALAANFIDQNLEAKWDATQRASDWLSQQLVGLKAKLEKSEEDLQRYAKENSILFLDEKQNMGTQKLKQLQEEATRAEADRMQKESVYNQIRGGDFTLVPGSLEDRLYQDLSVRLADLKREYSDLSATFTPEYPRVKRLSSQIAEIEQLLQKEREALARRIADNYRAAVNRERLLSQAVAVQTKDFNEIAEKSIQYNILQREVQTNKQLYEGLLTRLKEASVSAGLKASNIRVVDPAEVPQRPAKPRTMLNLALSLLVGLTMGIGMAFLQEFLDNTLKTPADVEKYLGLPALGVIPAVNSNGRAKLPYGGYGYGYGYKSRKALPIPADPEAESIKFHPELIASESDAHLAEAYRSLRTSVLLSTSGRPPRVLLVTSGQIGEGKTTTTVNLAITLVQLGGRVLLVDSDMRKPRVGTLLKIPSSPAGLSTLLTGQFPLEEVVVETQIPNLFVLPCGPIPPNPAELLSSTQMQQMIALAREKFEYVLFDSPPLLHVADGRILATQVEAVILVTHGGYTPREVAKHARTQLLQVNANVIGVALNNVDFGAAGYDYYYRYKGYGYGYRYGYGYGVYGNESKPEGGAKPGEA